MGVDGGAAVEAGLDYDFHGWVGHGECNQILAQIFPLKTPLKSTRSMQMYLVRSESPQWEQ